MEKTFEALISYNEHNIVFTHTNIEIDKSCISDNHIELSQAQLYNSISINSLLKMLGLKDGEKYSITIQARRV